MKNKTLETKLINKMFSITDIFTCYDYTAYKQWTYFPPENDFCDYTLILNGEAKFYAKSRKYNVKKGDLFIRDRNSCFHSEGTGNFYYLTLRFYIGENDSLDCLKKLYHVENTDYYQKLFYEVIRLYEAKNYMYKIKIASIIYNITASLVTSDASKSNTNIKYKKIENSVIYLNNNIYNSDLSIDSVAQKSGISTKHFRTLFKEIYGVVPTEHITTKRLEKSKDLLCYSGYSVKEIAEMTGFGSAIYYDRLFKKHYGMTPGEFKNFFR